MYGPLLAIVNASKSAFDAMVKQHCSEMDTKSFIQKAQSEPDSMEGHTYRFKPAIACFYLHLRTNGYLLYSISNRIQTHTDIR